MRFILGFVIWGIFFYVQDKLLLNIVENEYGEEVKKEVYHYWSIVIIAGIILGVFNPILGLLVAGGLIFIFKENLHYLWEFKNEENKKKAIIVWVMLVLAIIL